MLDYVKLEKTTIFYFIWLGILISLPAWKDLWIGIINTIFSIVFTLIFLLIIMIVFNAVANWYGLYIKLEDIWVNKKMTYYSILKKEITKKEQKIRLSFLLTSIFGIFTIGIFVPILLGIRPIIIESKRIGKSKSIYPAIGEINRIILISIILLWVLFSAIKFLSSVNPILYGFSTYFLKFLIFFTYSAIIPWNLLLSGVLGLKLGYDFNNRSIGDNLFASLTRFYLASIVTISLLPIVAMFFDPIFTLIFSIIVYSAIWLRLYSSSTLS